MQHSLFFEVFVQAPEPSSARACSAADARPGASGGAASMSCTELTATAMHARHMRPALTACAHIRPEVFQVFCAAAVLPLGCARCSSPARRPRCLAQPAGAALTCSELSLGIQYALLPEPMPPSSVAGPLRPQRWCGTRMTSQRRSSTAAAGGGGADIVVATPGAAWSRTCRARPASAWPDLQFLVCS